MSIYVMAGVNVRDPVRYEDYAEPAIASLLKYNVEILAVSNEPVSVEGTSPYGRYVLLKFPDRAALDRWYQSPEYQRAKPIRHEAAETGFFVVLDELA